MIGQILKNAPKNHSLETWFPARKNRIILPSYSVVTLKKRLKHSQALNNKAFPIWDIVYGVTAHHNGCGKMNFQFYKIRPDC